LHGAGESDALSAAVRGLPGGGGAIIGKGRGRVREEFRA
jgi:hypothetical protein